jgi:hypothetical protein
VRLGLDGERVVEEERLLNGHTEGIADVREAPDGSIWVLSAEGSILRLTPGTLGVRMALEAAAEPAAEEAVVEQAVFEEPVVIEAAVAVGLEEAVDPRPARQAPTPEAQPSQAPPSELILVGAGSDDLGPIRTPSEAEAVPLLPPPETAVVEESALPPPSIATTQQRTKTPRERYAQ